MTSKTTDSIRYRMQRAHGMLVEAEAMAKIGHPSPPRLHHHRVRLRPQPPHELGLDADFDAHDYHAQRFQGSRLVVPRREELQPIRKFLAERYELFRRAS